MRDIKIMKHLKLVIGVILLILIVVFTAQNAQIVQIKFLLWTSTMSLALVIFFTFFIGLIIGWVINSLARG